ncbi:YfiR family protein [Planctobacterium marinum]|uniref:YfiR family protein n=1 Tax=Planctobacterium marinum TaxID=1631968 RepID=A0AA48KU09_9ALTE|nr:hypothetical protein MACH26_36250 [Planctobacterium marinum]
MNLKVFKRLTSILVMSLVTWQAGYAQSFKPEELRASFLYHIAHYTSYPDESFNDNTFNFCFMEDANQSHTRVFNKLPKKRLKDKDIKLVSLETPEQLNGDQCQVIFIGKQAESQELFAKLEKLNKTIVSVGETRDFIENGGMITIVPLQSKMRIFFSQEQYENTSLKFSSLLLKRANFR